MLDNIESLVKYNEPELVSKIHQQHKPHNLPTKAETKRVVQTVATTVAGTRAAMDVDARLGVGDGKCDSQTLLNLILPPREWVKDGQLWRQTISSEQATKRDVAILQKEMENRMKQHKGKDMGICPVRRELYADCFEELLRQVAIEVPERGHLLAKVRDHMNITILMHQKVYESNVTFGIRKAVTAKLTKADMENTIKELEAENQCLLQQLADANKWPQAAEKREAERRATEEVQHAKELESLKATVEELKSRLLASVDK
ncbi:axonemal dynein light intermediate polypeptide 1-like [Corticium candelabrum]|uniref:axonemal dynein light intermediate polypeptide 1-like n=1 Tax=Corticium candelabrum TaxID=121492 RepID=UPI002E26A7C4|nr:axonemal dynein light intermediate polypeptide 1-like [Corticium candelabrum]